MASPLTTARSVRRLILYCALCVTIFSACVHSHTHDHSHGKPSKVLQFRERWDATEVIRDVDHIKEDLANLVDIQNAGEMTDEQVTFYFFHMHDFDDNHLLDGIELASAMQHSIEHFIEPSKHQSFDSVIMIVDGLLTLDKNNDGFVSYPDHIKEDLANLVDIRDAGEITEEQVTFYFFRMHDFDDNHMLDGIELASAMQHSIEHFVEPSKHQSFDSVITIVDGLLMLDKNNDGFVSYPEMRAHKK
ncbi:hypothetical protein MTO96_000811 [Rhipicephalus appendiculatus]